MADAKAKTITKRMIALRPGQDHLYVLRKEGEIFSMTFDPQKPPSWAEEYKEPKSPPA